MKKNILFIVLLVVIILPISAQRRSDRKIIEIKKIIEITPQQEVKLRKAYEEYQKTSDSIIYKVSDSMTAALLKYDLDKNWKNTFTNILNQNQLEEYDRITKAPEKIAQRRSDRKILEIKKVIDISFEQEALLRKAYEKHQNTGDSILYKVDDPIEATLLKHNLDNNWKNTFASILTPDQQNEYNRITKVSDKTDKKRSDRKIAEIKKIITISPTQESILRDAYEKHQTINDSIINKIDDPASASQLKYNSDKEWNELFMNTLTENQRNRYIRITTTPEVNAKAAAKVEVLKEAENYNETQLEFSQLQIFEYLMQEKIVYSRDKYDYRKQKENIGQLKKKQPARLKQANAQEKAKVQKKTYEGRTSW